MSPPPYFDFRWYRYTATVNAPFTAHCYSQPLNSDGVGGEPTGVKFNAGEWLHVLEEVHQTSSYVAVLTSGGWVNLWCARNAEGREVGLNFCRLHWHHK